MSRMKPGQLIEYNLRNIFLEKSYANVVEKLVPGPFLKNQNWAVSIFWSFIYFGFIVCQVENYRNWLKLRCRLLVFTFYKAFLKNKKWSGTSLPASFFARFLKKNISLVTFYCLTKLQCLVVFTSWDIGQYVYSIVC